MQPISLCYFFIGLEDAILASPEKSHVVWNIAVDFVGYTEFQAY